MVALLLAAFLSLNPLPGTPPNDWLRLGLQGRVETVQDIAYQAIPDGFLFKAGAFFQGDLEQENRSWKFDRAGFLLEDVLYNSEMERTESYEYQYSPNHREAVQAEFDYLGNLTYRWETEYDEFGRKIQVVPSFVHANGLGGAFTERYAYPSAQSAMVSYFYPNGSLWRKEISFTDASGRLTKKEDYDGDGLVWVHQYFYSEDGRERKHLMFHPDLTPTEEGDFQVFNQNGKLLTYIKSFPGFECFYRETYQYDPYGNETEFRHFDETGVETTHTQYQYQYDTHHNWVQCLVFHEGAPAYMRIRTFRYYEE